MSCQRHSKGRGGAVSNRPCMSAFCCICFQQLCLRLRHVVVDMLPEHSNTLTPATPQASLLLTSKWKFERFRKDKGPAAKTYHLVLRCLEFRGIAAFTLGNVGEGPKRAAPEVGPSLLLLCLRIRGDFLCNRSYEHRGSPESAEVGRGEAIRRLGAREGRGLYWERGGEALKKHREGRQAS